MGILLEPGLEGAHLRWAFTLKCLGASAISLEYRKTFTGDPNRLLTRQHWKQEALRSGKRCPLGVSIT